MVVRLHVISRASEVTSSEVKLHVRSKDPVLATKGSF